MLRLKSYLLLCIFLWAAAGGRPAFGDEGAKGAAAPTGLRPLTGTVGLIDRGAEALSVYLDRLEATLFLEQAHNTVSPYVVSIANSLEAMDEKERQGRGDRLLQRAYVMLAALSGPQAGRLSELYAAGLSQLLQVPADETTVTPALQQQLRAIGAYAAATAHLESLAPAEQAALRTELLLGQGRHAEAARQAQAWEKLAPSPISKTFRLGAQLAAGQATAARELGVIERDGGAVGNLAGILLRQVAREALVLRLGQALGAAQGGVGVPREVQEAASSWHKPDKVKGYASDHPLREACQRLGGAARQGGKTRLEATLADCTLLLLEGVPGQKGLKELPWPGALAGRRGALLGLSRDLGVLLGLLGRPATKDPQERARALEEVVRLLPQSELSAEDAGAVALLAQIAAAQQPGIPAHLLPAVDKYLQAHGCSPLAVPLLLGRHAANGAQRQKALQAAVERCAAPGEAERPQRADEALRLLAALLLAEDPGSEGAFRALQGLSTRYGQVPGQGRFVLSAADGAALRALGGKAVVDAAALASLQHRYEAASAALVPWDGPEAKGRAEAQVATLLLRRHQLVHTPQLLQEANSHLRYAQLLTVPDEAALVQSLEVYAGREMRLQAGKTVAAPKVQVEKFPSGIGRRLFACELALTARQARDVAGATRYAALAQGEPLPQAIATGQPRLVASLGIDERLRVLVRGNPTVVVLPRCSAR